MRRDTGLARAVVGRLVFACTWPCVATAATTQDPGRLDAEHIARLDALFANEQTIDRPTPGYAAAVFIGNDVEYVHCFGLANVEHEAPITRNTVFRVGELSEQFVAACVLVLEQDGKLSLDDDIRKHVPEAVARIDEPITIRNLLDHTSGIRDYHSLLAIAGRSVTSGLSDDEVLALLGRQRALEGMPGETASPSGSNYFLLTKIVERVSSGAPFRLIAHFMLFDPLGMESTLFLDDERTIVPNRADGYEWESRERFHRCRSSTGVVGDVGLATTIDDLLRWHRNLMSRAVVGDALVERLEADSLEARALTAATIVDTYRGVRRARSVGFECGFSADFVRFPEKSITVVLLSNSDRAWPDPAEDLVDDIVEIVLGDDLEPAPDREPPTVDARPDDAVELSLAEARAMSGTFFDPVTGQFVDLNRPLIWWRVPGHGPFPVPLSAVSRNELTGGVDGHEFRLVFSRPATAVSEEDLVRDPLAASDTGAGRFTAVEITVDGRSEGLFLRLIRTTTEECSAFLGRYECEEIDAVHELLAGDSLRRPRIEHLMGDAYIDKMHLEFGEESAGPFYSIRGDRFVDPVAKIQLRFERDHRGGVSGYRLSIPGLSDLRFDRVETPKRAPPTLESRP